MGDKPCARPNHDKEERTKAVVMAKPTIRALARVRIVLSLTLWRQIDRSVGQSRRRYLLLPARLITDALGSGKGRF
jgi:hypothetical protein